MTSSSWLSQKQYYSVQFHAFAKSPHQILKILTHAYIYHNMNRDIWVTSTSYSQVSPPAINCLIQSSLQCPFHPTVCRESAARKALKLTITVTMVADGNTHAPELSKSLFLNIKVARVWWYNASIIKVARVWYKASIYTHLSLPVLGPICYPRLCGWGHPLVDARPFATFSTLSCSKQTQEVLDKQQMVRERKSVGNTSWLHNAKHRTS